MKPINIDPPFYLYFSVGIMLLLHFFVPVNHFLHFPLNLVGLLPLILGIIINLLADSSFKRNETTVKPVLESKTLITNGIFRISRNPMYLGFVLILLGIGLLMGSFTPYIVVLTFTIFLYIVFIRYEEKKLEKTFGEDWLDYKKKVKRWI